jgi:2-isopropylmalate synthase
MINKQQRVYIYDTTLRDGAQTSSVNFTAEEKIEFVNALRDFGVDYIEAGWPGANEVDDVVFDVCRMSIPVKTDEDKCKITAFGMTKKHGNTTSNDPVLAGLVNSGAKFFCIVGKTWDFHVKEALGITLEQNIECIKQSVEFLKTKGFEVLYDAEHYFDAYKANKDYAILCIKTAMDAGASWIVLCDTNGGMLPEDVYEIVLQTKLTLPDIKIGIHTHNDAECAVANSLAAVRAGARLVQGTINGLGERCGNANLCSIIPTLILKMGYDCGVSDQKLANLIKLSKKLDDILNKDSNIHAPYVGSSAFAHKGGLHASAVLKNPDTYEHIKPELVGNERKILVSNQAGKANVIAMLAKIGLSEEKYISKASQIAQKVKNLESIGYSFDGAEASFEVFVKKQIDGFENVIAKTFSVVEYDIPIKERDYKSPFLTNFSDGSFDEQSLSIKHNQCMASIDLSIKSKLYKGIDGLGTGPVNAIDDALRKVLIEHFEVIKFIELVDYKVKIVKSSKAVGTASLIAVRIKCSHNALKYKWNTIGIGTDIIRASIEAMQDAYLYPILKGL